MLTQQENLLKQQYNLNVKETKQEKEKSSLLLEETQHTSNKDSIHEEMQNKDDLIKRLKIDLKKPGVLLKDAQVYIDLLQKQNNNKTLKHLTTQIKNMESEKNTIL